MTALSIYPTEQPPTRVRHTPAPWGVERVPIQSRGGSNTCHKIGPFQACIYDDWRPRDAGISEEENEANARLIAAAPELLATLEKLMECWDSGGTIRPEFSLVAEAKGAIARATIAR